MMLDRERTVPAASAIKMNRNRMIFIKHEFYKGYSVPGQPHCNTDEPKSLLAVGEGRDTGQHLALQKL